MTRQGKVLAALGFAAIAVVAGAAYAQAEDATIAAARAGGDVGEQADGYLGIAGAASPAVQKAVDAVNIKRRAIYTDIAAKQGATIQEVAAARGCDQLSKRVKPGEKYRAGGSWQTRGAGPIALPGVCG